MAESTSGDGSKSGKVNTGRSDDGSCGGVQPTDAEKQPSSGKFSVSTLNDSGSREGKKEEVSESPTVESCIIQGERVWLLKTLGDKTYKLPLEFSTKPEIRCSKGYECIYHKGVVYQLRQPITGSQCMHLLNLKTNEFVKLYEYSIGEGDIKSTKNRCSSTTEGGCKENHNDEVEDKSGTGARMFTRGNTVGKFQAERDLAPDLKLSQVQIGDHKQKMMNTYSGEKTTEISNTTDVEVETHTNKEKANQLQGNTISLGSPADTKETPEREASVEDSHPIDEGETDKKLGATRDGGCDNLPAGKPGDICDGNASEILRIKNVSNQTGSKPEDTCILCSVQKLETDMCDKFKRGLDVEKTGMNEQKKAISSVNGGKEKERSKEKLSQMVSHETNENKTDQQLEENKSDGEINREVTEDTFNEEKPKGLSEQAVRESREFENVDSILEAQTSQTNLNDAEQETNQICGKMSPDKSVGNTEKVAKEGPSYEDKETSDGGGSGSKVTSLMEDQSVHGRNNTSQERTGEESPGTIQENISMINAPADMEMTSTAPPRKRQTSSSVRSAQKPRQEWRYDDGHGYTLKLLIEYIKKTKKRNDAEDDFYKHEMPCCRTFFFMWNFYTETDCGKKMLDNIISKHNCQLLSSPKKSFKVSGEPFQDESEVKDLVDHVLDSIYICAQESLSIESIGVDPRRKEDIQEKIKLRKELDCAWIKFVGEDKPINAYIVCQKDQQQLVMQMITEVITDATKSYNNHKEVVAADFMWQRVMIKLGYLNELYSNFPQIQIRQDEELNAFQLMGPRDETKAVVGYLEDLKKTAKTEVHEKVFSPDYQFEIFTYPEMHDYIDSNVGKPAVIWIPNIHTKEIHLFSKDLESIKGIDKAIKGCVHEKLYSLSKDNLRLHTEKVQLIEELKKKHKGKIVINSSASTPDLLVTTADDIFKGVDAAVQEIISSEIGAHLETRIPEKLDTRTKKTSCKPELGVTNVDMEKKGFPYEMITASDKIIPKTVEVTNKVLFQKLVEKNMVELIQMAEDHNVSLEISQSPGSRVGFKLKGPEREVQYIYECINKKIQAEEQQTTLQQDNSGMAGATLKVDTKLTPRLEVAGMSGSSQMSGENDETGLQQTVWTYPNKKQVILRRGTICDDCVFISLSYDQASTSMKDDWRIWVPLWKEGKDHEKEKLREEIKRILMKASADDERSVGISISPVRGWRFKTYLKCFLYQLDQFHSGKADGCLVECFILFTEDGDFYKTAFDIMQQHFKDKASMIAIEPQELKNRVTSPKDEKEPFFKKIKVSIQKGELHNAKAEVFINTISQNLDLSKGVISASLLKKAGQGIQKEIRKKEQPPVPYGYVIKTSSGQLPPPCKAVLHVVLQQYHHSDDSTSTFDKLLKGCLEQASKYQSVAFPAIGTGKLGYPKDLVACLMLTAVLKFELAHPHTSLKEVKFVIYPDDKETYQAFKSQLHSIQSGPGKSTAAEQPEMMIADQYVSKTLEYGEVKVHARLGAIETEASDCLMVFYEKGCLFKNEIKVLSLAGNSVRQKWIDHRGHGNFNNGLILVTDGGDLKYTKIIHVACDINTINKAAIEGLQKAESEKMKTIVIPFIQKDSLLRDLAKYCTEILNAVKELATSFSLVNSVVFVIQGLSNFPDFNAIFEMESKNVGIGKIIGKSVKPTASFPSEPKEQQIPRDEKRVDPETVQQSMKGYEVSLAGGKCQLVHTSRERCCIIVSGDIKSREDLKKRFSSYNHDSNKLKYVVYPYEKKSALVIFEKEVDITTVDLGTDVLKVEPLPPQFLQELEFLLPNYIVERADSKGQMEKMFTNLKETCGIEVNDQGKQVYLVGITAFQMDIAKHCLEEFCEARLNIKVKKSSKSLSSSSLDEDSYDNYDILRKVSEVEFKALKIIENGFEKINAKISWNDDAVTIFGTPSYTSFVVKELNSRLGSLRNKQLEEIFLDEEEKKVVEHVIEEVQSKDTICVLEEIKRQVVVYADKQDDIMKFKHKLKLKTGKVKESGRSRKRFAESIQSMESSRGDFSSSVRSTETNKEFSWSKDASDVEVLYTKENIKVAVYKADILNLPVDCIVNAANDSLSHGGGVAKVIADAAGPLLVQEGDAIIRQKGNVPVGCQVTTTAGRLPYKCVIHTVGPRWSDYNPRNYHKVKDCENDLYRAIYGCFLEAEKNGVSMIALPAVSSGIYAVPQDMCAVQYAQAVLDYSRKSVPGKSLTEIHFVDRIPHLVKLMQDTFRTMIQTGKVPNYNIQNYVASSSYQGQELKETGRKGYGKQDLAANKTQYETAKYKEFTPVYYESDVHHKKHFEFQVSAKPVVHIYEGNILKLKNLNAVVCPDDSKGTGIGMIASELLKKPKYKDLKEKSFKGKKHNLGDVVITYGQDNPFNVIVHVVIENSAPKKPELKATVKMCIDNILRKTNEWVHVKTIALPLFGVKEGLLTEKSWAELFLERFLAFCHEVKNPNLEEVHIIVYYSQGVFSTLKKVFRDFADQMDKPQPQDQLTPPKQPLSNFHKMATDDAQDPMSNRGNGTKNDKGEESDSCTICMCSKTDPKTLSCGHSFCSECIDEMFRHKPVCPICGKIVGTLTGDQPKDGMMKAKTSPMDLAGYKGNGSIVITYDFPAGRQGPNHPSPGTWYGSLTRTAYLPNTPEGTKVYRMLKLAFDRRLMFTISTSRTTGKEGLTWNDIHHKTNPNPGTQFGYPDPEYLSRVKDELAAKGITEADLQPETA